MNFLLPRKEGPNRGEDGGSGSSSSKKRVKGGPGEQIAKRQRTEVAGNSHPASPIISPAKYVLLLLWPHWLSKRRDRYFC